MAGSNLRKYKKMGREGKGGVKGRHPAWSRIPGHSGARL